MIYETNVCQYCEKECETKFIASEYVSGLTRNLEEIFEDSEIEVSDCCESEFLIKYTDEHSNFCDRDGNLLEVKNEIDEEIMGEVYFPQN